MMRTILLMSVLIAQAQAPELKPIKPQVPQVKQKVPFAVKHPKIHRRFRKLRRGCQVVQPILDATGAAAQIVQHSGDRVMACKTGLHNWHRNFALSADNDQCHRCGILRWYADVHNSSVCEPGSAGRIQQDRDEITNMLDSLGRNPEAVAIRESLGWSLTSGK